MSKRYGKKRVPDCTCDDQTTCRACLLAAGPTLSDPCNHSWELRGSFWFCVTCYEKRILGASAYSTDDPGR